MAKSKSAVPTEIMALKVQQWATTWDDIKFDGGAQQPEPSPFFYLFSVRASVLKALTGVYRRTTRGGTPRAKDPNVQRGHEEGRSDMIREFVKFGFPWCEMNDTRRKLPGADDLRKPGWLPTAILVNILEPGAVRNKRRIPEADLVRVEATDGFTRIALPKGFSSIDWEPEQVFPIEVIDGQHRLWAFEGFDPGADYELPVVAFHGLAQGWQAYLFWSVNITPKKINRSLAFDLYPLLRREGWLDRFSGHSIYRETRCQELVEAVWSHPSSTWFQRINMLGETTAQRGNDIPMVSQAAWVRSLMASFVKEWPESGPKLGGLFGAPRSSDEPLLPWNRAMQAGFLLCAGWALKRHIVATRDKWASDLRRASTPDLFESEGDSALYGRYSLLTTDQGIRGLLYIWNDLCFVRATELGLADWVWETRPSKASSTRGLPATEEEAVTAAFESLKRKKAGTFLDAIGKGLSSYDWRTSSAPGITEAERLKQAVFRGSSGYKELRKQLLQHLAATTGEVAKAAREAANLLGF